MKKSNKANKRFFIASFLLLSTACAVSQAAAQVAFFTTSQRLTLSTTGAARDTGYYAFPPAFGKASVSASLSAIDPPDAVITDGAVVYTVKQLTGTLADSVKLYRKPLTAEGNVVIGDSCFVLGAAATFYTFTGAVGSTYGDLEPGTTCAYLYGSAIYLQVGDVAAGVARTFQVTQTSRGIYEVH